MSSVRRGPTLGCYLGVANAMICGLGIALGIAHRSDSNFAAQELSGILGFSLFLVVPGALFGLGLGFVAERLAAEPIWARRGALVVPAFVIVAMLGAATGLDAFVVVSCIPTLAGVLILERRTRAVSPVPEALAR
jgi:hypothetical protein